MSLWINALLFFSFRIKPFDFNHLVSYSQSLFFVRVFFLTFFYFLLIYGFFFFCNHA